MLISKIFSKFSTNKKEPQIESVSAKLDNIYNGYSPTLALYHANGERGILVINGKKQDNNSEFGGILSNNLFESSLFTEIQLEELEKSGEINKIFNSLNVTIKKLTDNNTYKYIIIIEDISSILSNLEERTRHEDLIKFAATKSQIGISFYNINTKEGKATDSWYNNLCEERGEKINPHYSMVPTNIKEGITNYLQSLNNGETEPYVADFEIKSPIGIKWIREHIFIHKAEKNNIEVIDINLDITELKESENILIALNDRVMATKQESDKFLNSISHEIRTPLNSILGFSGLYAEAEDQEDKVNFGEIIQMNINQLIELVNNITFISKLDNLNINLTYENIKIDEILPTLKNETEYLLNKDKAYAGKNITIRCEINTPDNIITTDKQMLRLVFSNLLSNALKFTETGDIIIGYNYNRDNNEHSFYVKDTGIGIDKKHFDKLFERFEKIDTFTQGTGLGLSLCKSIINVLGGDILVESELHVGTTVHFTVKSH